MRAIAEETPIRYDGQRRGASSMADPAAFVRDVLVFLAFELAFYFAYDFGMSFSQATASPFWFPDSVLLCALLFSPPRRWWIFILGALPIRLFAEVAHGIPQWFLLATFAIDSVKGLCAAALLRRCVRHPARIQTVGEYGLYCLFVVLLIPAVAALAGAEARHALGHDYWSAWEQWFLSNALTHLVVTPALLYWLFGMPWRSPWPPRGRCIEAAAVTLGLVVTANMAFDIPPSWRGVADPLFYAPVPFLFWAAVRFGMFGACGSITILAGFAIQAALQGRGPFTAESPQATAHALQHFLLLRAAPLYLVAVLVEQRKGDERALRESETRFRDMADTAPVMIWMSGLDKRCTYFNRRWLEFTGRSMDDELGDGWISNVHPDDLDGRVGGYLAAFDARAPFSVEYRLRRHDGQYRWILANAIPRSTADGEFSGYIGSCLDITDRRLAEADAQRLQVELAHFSRVSTLGLLASSLAHELNQPLGAILRNAEAAELFLQENQPDLAELRAIVADIHKDDQRASRVIDRLRALLQRRELNMQSLSLPELIEDIEALLHAECAARHVSVVLDTSREPLAVRGDRVQIQQVLLNLMLNGVDALSEMKDGVLKVRARVVNENAIEISVADNGPGIPPDKINRLFEPFFTTKARGMGFGLSISRTIVEAHHGQMWAENNADGGATFRFTLPRADIVS